MPRRRRPSPSPSSSSSGGDASPPPPAPAPRRPRRDAAAAAAPSPASTRVGVKRERSRSGSPGRAPAPAPATAAAAAGDGPADDLTLLQDKIERTAAECAAALSAIPPARRPSDVVMDRMVRAVMRTLLFRAGRKPGAPVKRADLAAAAAAAAVGGGGAAAPAGRRAPAVPAAVRDAVLKAAAARFAAGLGLELASLDVGPARAAAATGAARGGRVGGASARPAPPAPAHVLRTLLPPRLAAAVRAAAAPTGAADAPGVGLLAAALVRLDRGGAGTPAPDLAALLAAAGAAPGGGRVPGVGDPADALAAAVDARWLVSRRERAADGGGVDVYALGEAALADGGAAVDGFIKTVFESADPRRALEAAGGGG